MGAGRVLAQKGGRAVELVLARSRVKVDEFEDFGLSGRSNGTWDKVQKRVPLACSGSRRMTGVICERRVSTIMKDKICNPGKNYTFSKGSRNDFSQGMYSIYCVL